MTVAQPMGFYRACVKFYSPEMTGNGGDAAAFVPIFHDWIRERLLDVVLLDVADYAHVPDSPGIMLISHEASFALDRSDGRFGLLVQRRLPVQGPASDAIAVTLRQGLQAAALLQRDPRLDGRLDFDTTQPRIEANDRLRLPNTEAGFRLFEPVVREAVAAVYPGSAARVSRVENDPRDRLAVQVRLSRNGDPG